MSGDHDRGPFAGPDADYIPHLVDADLLNQWLQLFAQQGRDFVFIAGKTVGVSEQSE
jgi:hypothetical protein